MYMQLCRRWQHNWFTTAVLRVPTQHSLNINLLVRGDTQQGDDIVKIRFLKLPF